MRRLHLKFPGRAAARAALGAIGMWNENGSGPLVRGPILSGFTATGLPLWTLVEVGKLYAQNGTTTDGLGNTIPKMDPLRGYWFDLLLNDENDLEACKVIARALHAGGYIEKPRKRAMHVLAGYGTVHADRWRPLLDDFRRIRKASVRNADRSELQFEVGVTPVVNEADIADPPEPVVAESGADEE